MYLYAKPTTIKFDVYSFFDSAEAYEISRSEQPLGQFICALKFVVNMHIIVWFPDPPYRVSQVHYAVDWPLLGGKTKLGYSVNLGCGYDLYLQKKKKKKKNGVVNYLQ